MDTNKLQFQHMPTYCKQIRDRFNIEFPIIVRGTSMLIVGHFPTTELYIANEDYPLD